MSDVTSRPFALSIVVPVYNGAATVGELVKALRGLDIPGTGFGEVGALDQEVLVGGQMFDASAQEGVGFFQAAEIGQDVGGAGISIGHFGPM